MFNLVWSSIRRSLRVEGRVSVACVCGEPRPFHHWSTAFAVLPLHGQTLGLTHFLLSEALASDESPVLALNFVIEIETQHEMHCTKRRQLSTMTDVCCS